MYTQDHIQAANLRLKASFYLLLHNSTGYALMPEQMLPCLDTDFYRSFTEQLIQDTAHLPALLELPFEDRKEALAAYRAHLHNLMEMEACLQLYLEQLNYHLFVCRMISYQRVDAAPATNDEISRLIYQCIKFVEDGSSQNSSYVDRVGLLMANTPIKMTTANYQDYIKNGYKHLLNTFEIADESIRCVQYCKYVTLPEQHTLYGKYFPEYLKSYQAFYNGPLAAYLSDPPAGLTPEEALLNVYNPLDDLSSLLEQSSEALEGLHECCMAMLLLLTYTADKDQLFEGDLLALDQALALQDHLHSEIRDEIFQRVYDFSEKMSERFIDEAYEADQLLRKKYAKQKTMAYQQGEPDSVVVSTYNSIRQLFFTDIHQLALEPLFAFAPTEPLTKADALEQIQAFSEQLIAHSNSLPLVQKKLFRQFTFQYLISPYRPQDVKTYLNNCFGKDTDTAYARYGYYALSQLLLKIPLNEEASSSMHNPTHKHGCDCGCDHDHHHDLHHDHHHGCDCGHHHP